MRNGCWSRLVWPTLRLAIDPSCASRDGVRWYALRTAACSSASARGVGVVTAGSCELRRVRAPGNARGRAEFSGSRSPQVPATDR